jgi:hypothetical protein
MLFAIAISSPCGPQSANLEKFTAPGGDVLLPHRTTGKLRENTTFSDALQRHVGATKSPPAMVTGGGFVKFF